MSDFWTAILGIVVVLAAVTLPLWGDAVFTAKYTHCDLCGRRKLCRAWTGGKGAAEDVCEDCKRQFRQDEEGR